MPESLTDLEAGALEMCGYPYKEVHDDGFVIKEVVVDELLGKGTMCGEASNTAFDRDVITFLKSCGVEKFGVALHLESGEAVLMGAAKMSLSNAKKLEGMLEERGGSFRSGDKTSKGFAGFESE